MSTHQNDELHRILGPGLEPFADVIPTMLRQELLLDDRGFLARYQLCEALLSQITPEMKNWATPDVLRHILPETVFHKTRMQPIAGALGAVSCQAHPQLSYYPYIPVRFMAEKRTSAPLIVAVHGSSRNPKDFRDLYCEFAERHGCFVIAPLFPMDTATDVPDEEYKYLRGDNVRYDHALFAMIAEFAGHVGVDFSGLVFFGFSGGAQFGHRLLYLWPQKFRAMSFAAPGFVTLPSDQYDWWVGTRDIHGLFDVTLEPDVLSRTAVQLICGEADNFPYEIYSRHEMGMGDAAYSAYGATRLERIKTLKSEYDALGLSADLTIVPNCAHDLPPLLEASKAFLSSHIKTG